MTRFAGPEQALDPLQGSVRRQTHRLVQQQQAVEIGAELNAQAIFLGSVGESSTTRSGSVSKSTVTLVVNLRKIKRGQIEDPILREDDIVLVPESFF